MRNSCERETHEIASESTHLLVQVQFPDFLTSIGTISTKESKAMHTKCRSVQNNDATEEGCMTTISLAEFSCDNSLVVRSLKLKSFLQPNEALMSARYHIITLLVVD
jgi:hypothetical protein